jgi:small GTP-binding protein
LSIHKLYKIVIAGEGGVGKTTLIKRYTTGEFSHSKTTIGVSFAIANVQYDDVNIKLQIWDLGGEERFRNILPNFCKGAHGALIIFDLTRYSSFVALPEWIELIKNNTSDIPMFLVGSKADLVEHKTVSEIQINEILTKYNINSYFETSSKTGLNIGDLFLNLAKLVGV